MADAPSLQVAVDDARRRGALEEVDEKGRKSIRITERTAGDRVDVEDVENTSLERLADPNLRHERFVFQRNERRFRGAREEGGGGRGEGGREKARRRSRFEVVANEQPRSDAGEVAENRCEDFASEFGSVPLFSL